MKSQRRILGFLPAKALYDYLDRGCVLGARIEGEVVGYLLFASNPIRLKVAHLCVSEDHRGKGIARKLLEALTQTATTQTSISLHCRRDYKVNSMWPKLGFASIGEKPGRSEHGSVLTHWHLSLNSDQQPELEFLDAGSSDEAIEVIIDAQIFFDYYEPHSRKTEPSKALHADFWIDSFDLCITDELLNEIDRNDDPEQRRLSRARTGNYRLKRHSMSLLEDYITSLKKVLPAKTQSQESDIRHLAKAAASNVNVFVTRDQGLLKRAPAIAEITNLHVLSPTELIIGMHQLSDAQSYSPDRVSGLRLAWHRFRKEDFQDFPHDSFLKEGEGKGNFREVLDDFLSNPKRYTCELLKDGEDVVIIRTTLNNSRGRANVPLARVANSSNRSLFGRFLIADTLARAVHNNQDVVEIKASGISPSLLPDLLDMGFTSSADGFVKFCFSRCLGRQETLERITELSPESKAAYEDMFDSELERRCSPLSLDAEQSYFLIPIRPGYSLHLFDRQQSANDLFGADITVLLRWRNVYYRANTLHRMLTGPARLLWYVSGQKQVIATSRLDDVVIGKPKELWRRFRKFGVLEWDNLYEMCQGDVSKELMALQFSQTFLFRDRISLSKLRAIYKEDGANVFLQGPTRVPAKTFKTIFELGFPNH